MRCVAYARYSSDQQREASLADQLEVCRRYIERQGWQLVGSYEDAAVSGASRFRAGLSRLVTDADANRFEIVVCESLDRLGRKLADVADLFDRLTFQRIQVHATSIGLLTQMHVGIMGTLAQMTLADLRDKTRRGQLGRARAGRIPGGLAFGYEVVTPAPGSRDAGERRIKPHEADIVRRVFTEFAAGRSPRHIAKDLNAEGIQGPNGRPWIDTTIRGQVDRGTGLLNNTLYAGRLSWNRCSYIKDPRSGRRVARVNDRSQWEEVEVPGLRIVDQAVWDSAKARQQAVRIEIGRDDKGNALNRVHRRHFLLSGLLTCGQCGGGYTIMARDRYGCAARRSKGTCDNGHTISRQHIEARVLAGLKDRLLTADMVDEFVRSFEAELVEHQRHTLGTQARLQRELGDVERRLQGVLRAVENGAWNDSLKTRLTELEGRKRDLEKQLEAAAKPAPPVRLNHRAADIYRTKVGDLVASLNAEEIRLEAAEALRSLIDRVVLTPDPSAPDSLAVELHGALATILALASEPPPAAKRHRTDPGGQNEKLPRTGVLGSQLSVVAGARNHLDLLLTG